MVKLLIVVIVLGIIIVLIKKTNSNKTLESISIKNQSEVQNLNIDIQWGGYYASKDEDDSEYGVFRLLDFNSDAYHIAIFQEKFSKVPTLAEVSQLTPYIGHAPIDSKGLLQHNEIYLLGGSPLTLDDLEGYGFYLEHFEVSDNDIRNLFDDLIEFCNKPPMKLTLAINNDELKISER